MWFVHILFSYKELFFDWHGARPRDDGAFGRQYLYKWDDPSVHPVAISRKTGRNSYTS